MPNSRILAGPLGAEEDILYAECNLEAGIGMKLRHDFAGHYNRPDIFQLHINRNVPHLYTVHGPEEPIALSDADPDLKGLPTTESPTRISKPRRAQLGDGKNQGHLSADDD